MRSSLPKVLHPIAGRTMLAHVLASLEAARVDRIAVVVGPGHEAVVAEVIRAVPHASVFVQNERLGTAHAVLAARASIAQGCDDLVIAFADTPLVQANSFTNLRAALVQGASVAVLGFEAADPTGYGRLLRSGTELIAIREHKDASGAERAITLCNAGLMALEGRSALAVLDAIDNANAQQEFYLTDAVGIVRAAGGRAEVVTAPEAEVMGVNDRVQLSVAERLAQGRLREAAMRAGVTLQAPDTVFLSFDTQLSRDVVIEPHVVIGPGVTIGEGAKIHAFSHLERASVAAGASIGPFARLRPGAQIDQHAKIGNFVEIKAARIGEGAAVSHLTYIGDASVGAGANVGAGTITCNYDGHDKAHTEIGAGAFIGSNSALVAPVTIGAGAYVGSGSVITQDVAPGALAIARGRQVEKAGWAEALRVKRHGQPKKRP